MLDKTRASVDSSGTVDAPKIRIGFIKLVEAQVAGMGQGRHWTGSLTGAKDR